MISSRIRVICFLLLGTSLQSWGFISSLPSFLPTRKKTSNNFCYSSTVDDDESASQNYLLSTFKNDTETDDRAILQPICRIVTRADSKLPTTQAVLPSPLFQRPHYLLNKLDDYCNAKAHQMTRSLNYLQQEKGTKSRRQEQISQEADEEATIADLREDKQLVHVLRSSLTDAGFQTLSRRDIDLCDSLNVGYLLRLSIVPDVSELDPSIAREFYPERFDANGTAIDDEELLFGGRVLVYWRGYSEEVTRGRLILPKLDYLQASIVQGSAVWLKWRLDSFENKVVRKVVAQSRKIRAKAQKSAEAVADLLPIEAVGRVIRDIFAEETDMEATILPREEGSFKLRRYGGSKVRFVGSPNLNDALSPFSICEVNYGGSESPFQNVTNATVQASEHDMTEGVNHDGYTCEYDEKMAVKSSTEEPIKSRMELLERVSINNLVDVFTQSGRRKVIRAVFEKSELVEPTYEEVVVVWRPNIKNPKQEIKAPRIVSELADMFDIEGFEQPPKQKEMKKKGKLEIRNFEGVPMANLPAVLPKTKLIFRPADAFLFDMISFVTFLLVVGSVRLDSPRLDLLALVSVSLWMVRTVFRYSNKLARYDLLVKKFLTSKISHRNAGALKYIASEAGSQRATRIGLVHHWLSLLVDSTRVPIQQRTYANSLSRATIIESIQDGINDLLKTDKQVRIDTDRAFLDLDELNLIQFDEENNLLDALDSDASSAAIKSKWIEVLDATDDDSWSGGNSTDTGTEAASSKIDWEFQADGRVLKMEEFEERRRQFTASVSATQRSSYATAEKLLQKHKASGTLLPATDGPISHRDDRKWYF